MPVRPMLLHGMALVSFRLICKNLGNLQEFLGKLFTAPWPKIARTPMCFLPSPHVFCHSRPLRDTVLEPGTG